MPFTFKLIFRNWWKNKLFFIISVFSLAIGLACTNMLMVFVIYESNIEADNPQKKNILYMSQSFPMDTTKTVSYISGNIPQLLKDRYPEIDDYVRFQGISYYFYTIGDRKMTNMNLISADPSFCSFFPYEALHGNISKIFDSPNKIGISEKFAKQVFGDSYPIGQHMLIYPESDRESSKYTEYEIVAVLKNRDQALLSFDAITQSTVSFSGGITLLKTKKAIDHSEFSQRLKNDEIPTLMGSQGQYYFSTLQESYFSEYSNEQITYIKRQQSILLDVGWITSLLILFIACINYINLNSSRLLEQINLIKIQRLIGASSFQVGVQIFTDTFLTLLISFGLSILIVHDLTPAFNSIVSGRLNTAFFFSGQVFPILIFVLFLFSFFVALSMSYRFINFPIQISQEHNHLFKKRQSIRILSILQYAISLGLIIASITAYKQLSLVKHGGENYKQLFEIGSDETDPDKLLLFTERISEIPEIESITTARTSILYSPIRQLVIQDDQKNETFSSILEFYVNSRFLKTMSLELIQGLSVEEAEKTYAHPIYVNREFVRHLVPDNENPIGKPLMSFDKDFRSHKSADTTTSEDIATIAGVISSLYTGSFKNHIQAQIFHIENKSPTFALIRIKEPNPELLKKIEQIWDEVNPQNFFICDHVFEQYMERNKEFISFYNLLLMYAIISLFLTVSGLFGTAYYTTIQRTKEIGIRKINGATTIQIILLLNRRFIEWIGIALFISAPLTWFLLNEWLQHFAYRIKISFDILLIATAIVSVITLITASWHSYRVATRNPVKSLRSE